MTFTVASWNVNSLRVRLPQVLEWLAMTPVDVMALQETKLKDAQFPAAELAAAGYQTVCSGQSAYNGVALLSRAAITAVETTIPFFADEQRRMLAATINNIRIINLYVPNGAAVDSDKYPYKLAWLAAVANYLKQQLTLYPRVVVLGDFNIAPEDRDVHDPAAWQGQVLVSDAERAAWREILALGFSDAFRLFEAAAGHYSWWDYRQGAFRRDHGMRIDHILLSAALTECCKESYIDKLPRTWDRPSDHTPVVAKLGMDEI
jgi:exodeoxyribonuclease-3